MDTVATWTKAAKRRRARTLKALKPFDPYHSPLCTCAPKLTLNVYTGCGFGCFYCYTSSYARGRWGRQGATWSVRPDVVQHVHRDIERIVCSDDPEMAALHRLPVAVSLSSDPYPEAPQACERELGATRQCLAALGEAGFRLLIQTKSDLVCRDLDILAPRGTVIGLTITTLDAALAARMEPFCPPPERRIAALRVVADRGFPTLCRIDPIIPLLNDSPDGIGQLIDRLADAGVRHIVSSTFKKRADSARRFAARFSEAERATRAWYQAKPVSGYYYLEESRRRQLLAAVAALAADRGLTFACCRERLEDLNTACCDGQHLFDKAEHEP